jgi:hypothetical protein
MKIRVRGPEKAEVAVKSVEESEYSPSVSFNDLEGADLKGLVLDQEITVTIKGKIKRLSLDSSGWNCLEVSFKELDVKTSDSKMSDFVSEIEDD